MKTKILVVALLFIFISSAEAQFVEDALRYAKPNTILTPRAGGLNVAYHGISDDLSALLYNPAGLSLVNKSEFSIGLGFTNNNVSTDFLSSTKDFSANSEFVTHAGFVAPVFFGENNSAVAIGYFRENDFNNDYKYQGFNENSTYISNGVNSGRNWPYELLLADPETSSTVFTDSLQQNAFLQEKGGLHNISGGISFDVNKFVAVGFSITGKFGTYEYAKEYTESDLYDIYNTGFNDLNRLELEENVRQSVSGITGSIGLQARIADFMRFGASIKFPSYLEIDETFSQYYWAYYDNGDNFPYPAIEDRPEEFENSYNLKTPFVYSAGVSMHVMGLTFAAGVEYTDVTQLEFSDALPEVIALNRDIVEQLTGQVTWGFGAEYKVPMLPLIARAGYSKTTSPYHEDIANANKDNLSLGGSLLIGKNIRLDGVFRWMTISELRTNYGSGSVENGYKYIIDYSPLSIGLGFSYRY